MTPARNPVWAELVQLVPIVSLALPFIIDGKVDISRAGSGFLLGALFTIPVTTVVVARRHLLNPILIGAGLWLWLGAISFMLPIPQLVTWLVDTQAAGLFLGALAVGIVATLGSSHGYIGCHSSDLGWQRRASLMLLGLTVLVAGWAWVFRHDIRLGGGLPFIVLNVSRRLIGLRRRTQVET